MSPRADEGAPPGGEPEEIELKLEVADRALVSRLVHHPPASGIAGFRPGGPVRTITCLDRYFDTDPVDGDLRRAGVRARLREQGDEVVLAVKTSIATYGAVSRRVELQGPAVARLDPAAWQPSDARTRIVAIVGDRPLVEIAALRQQRLQRDFVRDGTTVEISLDRMTALDGRRVLAHRVEVEAELHAGDPADLQDLAAALESLPGVSPARGSKLAFALGARADTRAEPERGTGAVTG
jgi:inorganic triphosphatase YgiF